MEHLEERLREETEARVRLQTEAQDNERYRAMYLEARREWAAAQREGEQRASALQERAATAAIEAEDRVRTLEHLVTDLESRLDDRFAGRTLKVIQQEKRDLEDRVKALSGELELVRDTGDRTAVGLLDAERRGGTRVADLDRQCRILQAENERLVEHRRALEETQRTLRSDADRLHAEKLKLESEGSQLRQQLEGMLQAFKAEKAILKQAAKEREDQLETQIAALGLKMQDTARRLAEAEALRAEAVRHRSDMERSARDQSAALEREFDGRVRDLERAKGEALTERDAARENADRERAALQRQIETLRRDLALMQKKLTEETALGAERQSRCEALEQHGRGAAADRDMLAKALGEARDSLEESQRELLRAREARDDADRLRLQLEYALQDCQAMKAERDDLQAEFVQRLQHLQRASQAEINTLQGKAAKYKAAHTAAATSLERCKKKFAVLVLQSEKRGKEWRGLALAREREVHELRRQLAVFIDAPSGDDCLRSSRPLGAAVLLQNLGGVDRDPHLFFSSP
eukprot:TRINITY_DN2759_c0_g1_i1.p1 TRINITY_DN2759_c0_g1~~TRINITY_DN2759_c0_g1_i1.p1  ORF type:complete len:614 (+),score=149.15 TRINITY_DN2759_c0_g1_i1:275-1843(+)